MRIIHAADLHIDSQFDGLSEALSGQADPSLISGATRSAFANLVTWALGESPDALVLAGDIFDGRWRSQSTRRIFLEGMSRLHDAGIPVVMASGNHDAASVLTDNVAYRETMHVLPVDEAGTHVLADAGLAFHGQGYATPAITESLAAHYPDPIPGLVNIGVLHANVGHSSAHGNYSPCTEQDLVNLGYSYVALGHIHQRQVMTEGERIFASYPGNLQGRSIRETGAKGAVLVDLADPSRPRVDFHPLDVLRWESLRIDASDVKDIDTVLSLIDQHQRAVRTAHLGLPLILRVDITARSPLLALIRADEGFEDLVRDVCTGVLVEKVRVHSAGEDATQALPIDAELRVELEQAVARLTPAEVSSLLTDVRGRVRQALAESGPDLTSAEYLSGLIADAGNDLLMELTEGASGARP